MALMKCEECGKTVSEKAESSELWSYISLAAKAQGAPKLKTDEQITKKSNASRLVMNRCYWFLCDVYGNDIRFLLIAITNLVEHFWWKYGSVHLRKAIPLRELFNK